MLLRDRGFLKNPGQGCRIVLKSVQKCVRASALPSFLNTLVLKPASGAAGVPLPGRLPRVLHAATLESAL